MTLRSYEHKATSLKSAEYLPSFPFGWQKTHFSHQFRAIYYLITFLVPLWTFFLKKIHLFAPIHMQN